MRDEILRDATHPLSLNPHPWTLTGEAVVLLRDWRSVLALVHYSSSPVGPYDETAVIALTSAGPRVTQMSVSSAASRDAGRALWGFPKVLEKLRWQRRESRISFRTSSRRFHIRVVNSSFPLRFSGAVFQTKEGRCVRVPTRVTSRVSLAFCGRRLALFLQDFTLTVSPAELF